MSGISHDIKDFSTACFSTGIYYKLSLRIIFIGTKRGEIWSPLLQSSFHQTNLIFLFQRVQPLSGLLRLFSRFSGNFFRIGFFQCFVFQLDGILFHRLWIMDVGGIRPMFPFRSYLPNRSELDVIGNHAVVFLVQVQSCSER